MAASYPALSRFKFGGDQAGTAHLAADVPSVLAGQIGVLSTSLAEKRRDEQRLLGRTSGIRAEFASSRNRGGCKFAGESGGPFRIALRGFCPGDASLSFECSNGTYDAAAHSGKFRARFSSGAAFSKSSAETCGFAPPNSLLACKTVTMKKFVDLDETNPRLFVKKLNVNWGHASAQWGPS